LFLITFSIIYFITDKIIYKRWVHHSYLQF
jgi:hypothetical protein